MYYEFEVGPGVAETVVEHHVQGSTTVSKEKVEGSAMAHDFNVSPDVCFHVCIRPKCFVTNV